MKTKSLLLTALLIASLSLSACSKDTESTVSGMVVKKDGTAIYLMDSSSISINESRPTGDDTDGSRPSKPEGDFNPENFDGSMPSMPDGDFNPENFDGSMPSMPEGDFDGSKPSRPEGDDKSDRTMDIDESKLTKIDIADAHISIEIDDGKEAGSIDDVKTGSRVTVTLKGDKATNVLVSSNSGFKGGKPGKSSKSE